MFYINFKFLWRVRMIRFETITEESLDTALDILNSNPQYNTIFNGNPTRTKDDIRSEFINELTYSYLIQINNIYIGVIDFLENNPKDNYPWLGLLIIHGDYHSMGYGKKVYKEFEVKFLKDKFDAVRIGILKDNTGAKSFWTKLGFDLCIETDQEEYVVDCLEKNLK